MQEGLMHFLLLHLQFLFGNSLIGLSDKYHKIPVKQK